jgi:hypothetical protein
METYADSYREERSLRWPLAPGHLVSVFGHNATWRVTRIDRTRKMAEAEMVEAPAVRMAAPLNLLKKKEYAR